MKQFFWRFTFCILPCILAAGVTVDATMKYRNGDPGGFKLGVDLVGGTILVYEIDLRKSIDSDSKFDPVKDINVLAESLKRRIDPNDIYNITIRPAGGEGRIEIILPTGGTQRAKKAEAAWQKLLRDLEGHFLTGSNRKLEVGRGKILELANQIQAVQSDTLWEKQLFSDEKGWARLKVAALKYWALIDIKLSDEAKRKSTEGQLTTRWNSLRPGSLKDFQEFVLFAMAKSGSPTTPKTVQTWIKKQAWDETMTRVRDKWLIRSWSDVKVKEFQPGDYIRHENVVYLALQKSKDVRPDTDKDGATWRPVPTDPIKKWDDVTTKEFLPGDFVRYKSEVYLALQKSKDVEPKTGASQWRHVPAALEESPYWDELDRITPDRIEQLTTFVLTRGAVIGQTTLTLLQPLVGDNVDRVFDDGPTMTEIREYIKSLYGPPVKEVMDKIDEFMRDTNQSKDQTVEDVQRIKDLVTKIGSLEFRILANQHDDKEAIDETKKLINEPSAEVRELIKKAQEKGLPPPVPGIKGPATAIVKQRVYEITTARNAKSKITYSWIEVGPEERKALNLDNAARTDSARNTAWHEAARLRNKGICGPLPIIAGSTEQFLLQGALFYSRECLDQNLPEDERRKKEIEYFILTRDPEFEPENEAIRTKKIDGGLLLEAKGGPGQDLRPAVHFTFNTEGAKLFGNITRKNVSEGVGPENSRKYRHLAVILDGMIMSAPTINSEIREHGQISSPTFTQKQVDAQVNVLRAGRLPATLKPQPVSESTIAATLGEDTIAAGINAIGLAFLAVLVFMIVYYRFAGLVASVALLANLLLTIGFMVAVQATFTLSGLAGIVLTLGMAVDANVLIYERLREERERGASLLQAIRNGYDRALPTIIDTHLTAIFTSIVLYVVGNDNLKGFGITMIVGLVISLFTALYMTRVMFDFWQTKGWLTKLTMMRLFAKPDIDFMSIRYVVFGITLGVALLGAALFIGRLPNDLNIDFRGGTAYGGKLIKGVKAPDLRALVSEEHQKEVLKDVQVRMIAGSAGRRYELTFPNGDGKPQTVSFSNVPDGANEAEWVAAVKARASLLSEPSVDLLFNPTDDEAIQKEIDAGLSRNFVMRTTEKEPELVQTCLDQLLREKGSDGKYVSLLKKVHAYADRKIDDDKKVRLFDPTTKETRLRFYDEIPPTVDKLEEKKTEAEKEAEKKVIATASQSFLKSLFNRELRRAYKLEDDKATLPVLADVVPEGKDDKDGKYHILRISFKESDLKQADFGKIEEALANTIDAFARRPLPDRLENFDSALAAETRLRAMWAVLASWAAILVYLWFRFGNWTFGMAAVICLVHDLFFTIGAIAACYFVHDLPFFGSVLKLDDFKLDLAGVAALLTLVGYSVNDTIVVFDRIREVRGKNPDLTPKMINDSINQTLSRTVLASVTVWLVVVVLYWFGGPGVHLFAFVMVIGVIVGTFSSIYVASPLLLLFGEGRHEESTLPGVRPASPTPEGAVV